MAAKTKSEEDRVNWAAVQAVAEVAAALGVIISIGYLAVQVRQNTRSVRAAASEELVLGWNAAAEFMKTPYGARICHLGASPDTIGGLTPEERLSLRVLALQVLRVYEQAFYQHRAGMLDDRIWQGWVMQIQITYAFAWFGPSWPARRAMVHEDFARFVEELVPSSEAVWQRYMEGISLESIGESATTGNAGAEV